MPTPIDRRRARQFRPIRYSERHDRVAELLAAGLRRDLVAELSGYSPAHVSRIAHMPEARRDIAARLAQQAANLNRSFVQRIEALLRSQHLDRGLAAVDFVLQAPRTPHRDRRR